MKNMSKREKMAWLMRFLTIFLAVVFGLLISLLYNSKSYACTYDEAMNSDWSGYNYNDVVRILNEDLTEQSNLSLEQKKACLIGDMRDFYKEFDKRADGIKYEALTAISALETGHFSSDVCKSYNNVGGMRGADGYISFPSKEEGIQALSDLLSEQYLDPDGSYYEGCTILDIGKHYNQSVHWVNMYTKVRLDMEKRCEKVETSEEREEKGMTLTKEQEKVLENARKAYGSRNQLAVAAEECNELAIAVLKFLRYKDEDKGIAETYDKVLEERADVEIVLNHIDEIYKFNESELKEAIRCKIDRLKRWIETTSDIEYTTVDRELKKASACTGCYYYDHFEEAVETGMCKACVCGEMMK